MIKRMTWFVGGAVAGITGAGYAKRKVKETASHLTPAHVARTAVAKVRERKDAVVDAVREGREAMHAKEAELRADRDGTRATLADELEPQDRVLVDGRPVEPGQVIVLRQVRDGEDPGQTQTQNGQRRASRRGRRGA
jgi:hypothetical protein